jgi:ribose 5-phosphate isomerase B
MSEVIPIGSDHAGFEMEERIKADLARLGYEPLDLGTHSAESADYPDYAHPARFLSDEASIAILGAWLGTGFAGGRHTRRVAKIDQEAG